MAGTFTQQAYLLKRNPLLTVNGFRFRSVMSELAAGFQGGIMPDGALVIVSDEDLRKAQKDPNRYSHIMVRVFGFSTQFISLSRELQDYVIEKTKQMD